MKRHAMMHPLQPALGAKRPSIFAAKARGFTLIELMIVVVIIGVLSTLAFYGVNSYIRKSKTVEAREIVASIKTGQESFFDETFRYLSVNPTIDTFYPSNDIDNKKVQWGADASDCSGCLAGFRTLGVEVGQPVQFRYSTVAGVAGDAVTLGDHVTATAYNPPSTTTKPFYVVKAVADLDGDKTGYSVYIGSSFTDSLYEENSSVDQPGE